MEAKQAGNITCIQYKTPDDGQKTCLKHVQLYYKNKFEKLVHLVGFIIRIHLYFFTILMKGWDRVSGTRCSNGPTVHPSSNGLNNEY